MNNNNVVKIMCIQHSVSPQFRCYYLNMAFDYFIYIYKFCAVRLMCFVIWWTLIKRSNPLKIRFIWDMSGEPEHTLILMEWWQNLKRKEVILFFTNHNYCNHIFQACEWMPLLKSGQLCLKQKEIGMKCI